MNRIGIYLQRFSTDFHGFLGNKIMENKIMLSTRGVLKKMGEGDGNNHIIIKQKKEGKNDSLQ